MDERSRVRIASGLISPLSICDFAVALSVQK
jgi:hypothetical protein